MGSRVKNIRGQFACDEVRAVYLEEGSITAVAQRLGVSYGTAHSLVRDSGIGVKKVGYHPPDLPITGLQCRHAREYLGLTRDEFCLKAGLGKTALRQFELGKSKGRASTLEKIMAVFHAHAIFFDSDVGFSDENN